MTLVPTPYYSQKSPSSFLWLSLLSSSATTVRAFVTPISQLSFFLCTLTCMNSTRSLKWVVTIFAKGIPARDAAVTIYTCFLIFLVLQGKGFLKGHWLLRTGTDVFTRPPWLDVMENMVVTSLLQITLHLRYEFPVPREAEASPRPPNPSPGPPRLASNFPSAVSLASSNPAVL